MQTTKLCTRCRKEKPTVEFYTEADCRGGDKRRRAACKDCYNEMARAAHKRNRTAWNTRHRENNYKRRVGITELQRQELFNAAERRCEGCKVSEKDGRLCIDHCHREEIVRGVLCAGCNTVLALVKENPQTLRALADYVEHHAAALAALVAGEDQPPIAGGASG